MALSDSGSLSDESSKYRSAISLASIAEEKKIQ